MTPADRDVGDTADKDVCVSAPVMALTQRGGSPRQAEVSPACNRRLLRRGDTGWGAAGGELPVRNTVHERMDNVNSIRPDDGTSLLALCEVRPAAQASLREDSRSKGKGQRDSEGVLRQTVNDRKATSPSEGGWRQNGRKCKRGKQGDPLGSTRCSWPQGPKSRPAGVRASIVARKRVTSAEPRDAGRWKGEIQNNGRQTNASARKGYAVAGAGRAQLTWRAPKVWPTSLCGVSPHLAETPLTGKPDAGNPPVRFGGRGGAKAPSLPLSPLWRAWRALGNNTPASCARRGTPAARRSRRFAMRMGKAPESAPALRHSSARGSLRPGTDALRGSPPHVRATVQSVPVPAASACATVRRRSR
jgi:hypothetical protein